MNGRQRVAMLAAIVVVSGMASASPGHGQTFPSRPVTIVVSLAAGSGMDTVVRLYGERLSAKLGRPILVENRTGASQNLASGHVAAAQPDGHTLLVASAAPIAVNPAVFKKLAYDPQRDFVPIALYAKTGFVLIATPSLPVKTITDLAKHANAQSNPLSFGAAGIGGLQNLTMELIRQRFKFAMTNVPYKSGPQSIADVAAGHVNLAISETGASVPLIQSGKVRALAVTTLQRIPVLPDVPAVAESPGASEFEAVSWHVLLAPRKTPRAIVERLHQDMKDIMGAADVRERVVQLGLIPEQFPTVDGMERYMLAEREKWSVSVKEAGLERSQ
jgi:tripartite-type tricarboxylate transporter receptor subunit TctC